MNQPVESPCDKNSDQRQLQRPTKTVKLAKIFLIFCLTITFLLFFLVGAYFLFVETFPHNNAGNCSDKFSLFTNTSNDWLLPDLVYPVHYNLTLNVFLQRHLLKTNFHGRIWISLKAKERTRFIVLHSKDLSISKSDISVVISNLSKIVVNDSEAIFNFSQNLTVNQVTVHHETQRIIVELRDCLEVHNDYLYTLQINYFSGNIQNDGKGLYLSRYLDSDNRTVFLAATQFEVTEARKMFPCFDEPRFKANFTISVIRHKDMISLSNMHLIRSEHKDSNWVQDYFATSVKMSTYLVAVVVCDFRFKETTSNTGVKIRAYARPELLNDADYALNTAVRMLDHYEDYFQFNYPLAKLDLIALPDFVHGAMENWGLVTFRESTMLYNPDHGTILNRETVAMIVGHELAHQWFGNLVTMRWWNDLWLNEGFAHYMGYVSSEAVYPHETMEYSFLTSNPLEALKLDSLESTHAILMDVHHPNDIIQLFDVITYKKGACLVKMLHRNFGRKTFRDGLRVYFKKHAYGNTMSEDLWNSIEMFVNISSEQLWYVPLTYTDSLKQSWLHPQMIWLKSKTDVIVDIDREAEWIIANVNLNGFYRVNYDLTNWLALVDQLKTNHSVFTPSQRAQILSDSFELSISGTLDVSLALNLSLYLINENEYLPWMTATKNFLFIDTFMQTAPEYPLFLNFMQRLLQPVYKRFTWTIVEAENKYTSYLRFLVFEQSCHYRSIDCLNKTAAYLQKWALKGEIIRTFPEIKQVIKCYGLLQSKDDKFTNFVLSELKDLKSTMCSDDPDKLNWILHNTLNGTQIRVWNLNELIRSASLTQIGRKVAWNFVKTNWKYISETLNEVAGETAVIFTKCSQPEDLVELESFMAQQNVQTSWRKFKEAKEALKNNIKWRRKNLNTIISWLRSNQNV